MSNILTIEERLKMFRESLEQTQSAIKHGKSNYHEGRRFQVELELKSFDIYFPELKPKEENEKENY